MALSNLAKVATPRGKKTMTTSKPIRILCLEDDRGLARLLQKKMIRQGFAVDLVHDGPTGIDILHSEDYDALIVDHKMPGKSGLEVIRQLAANGKLLPTLMVTGAGDEKLAVEALKLGAGDYIVKDAEGTYLELLPAVIRKLLDQKRLADAKEQAERELHTAYTNLEKLVQERTEALMEANKALREEIKERTRAEKLLRDASENLEEIVEERTRDLEIKTKNLEELNVALEVLLKKREEDKQDLEKNFVHNITNLVLPYIEKLKGANLTARQRSFIETIESNIHDIVAPFARGLSSEYFNLTPTEIRVATLIKQDKTAREIAEMHNVSKSAIVFHSHNIRKKLGLKDKKINLKTYLRSLQ